MIDDSKKKSTTLLSNRNTDRFSWGKDPRIMSYTSSQDSQNLIKHQILNHVPEIENKSVPFSIILMISFFDFGSSFVYDIPQSLSTAFCDTKTLEICGARGNLFYSAYSLPNLFVILIGGYLLFKIGHKKCLIIYSLFINIGMLIFVLGAVQFNSF